MIGRDRSRRLGTALGVVCGWLAVGGGVAVVRAQPEPPQDPGEQPEVVADDVAGAGATVSGDGRYVVHAGPRGRDGSGRLTVWLADREAGAPPVDLVPRVDSVRGGDSVHPVISGDGCSVTMITEMALDAFRDDDSDERWDVYRLLLPHCGGAAGDWELVSTEGPRPPTARNDVHPDDPPAVTRSGTLVAYTHAASHLAEGGMRAVSVVDLTVPIQAPSRSLLAAGLPTNAPDTVYVHVGMDQPALSGDGRYLAFRSDARSAEPVPRWADGVEAGGSATAQVFVWDRRQPDRFEAVTLVSTAANGDGAATGAGSPVLSGDGRVVAFVSTDTALAGVPRRRCGEQCATQVFRLDRDTDTDGAFDEPGSMELSLLSAEPGTRPVAPGRAPSMQPAVSADGQVVVFVTKAPNLKRTAAGVGGDVATGDLLRWDAAGQTLERVVPAQDVSSRAGTYGRPATDDTGRTTVYDGQRHGENAARAVRAVVAPPELSLADVDLGSTLVGKTSDEWYVAVINDGPSAFRPSEVSISDEHFTVNEEESSCLEGITVPPGGDCIIRLTFTPTEPGRVTATLRVAEQGFGGVAVEAEVSGAGGEPSLRIEPAGADLGLGDIGRSGDPFHFDVVNTSPTTTEIVQLALAGSHPDDFRIASENCLGRAFNPRAACTVGLVFAPVRPGRRTALVEVRTRDEAYATFLVSGEARYRPELGIAEWSVAAGDRTVAGGTGYPPDTELTVRFADVPSTIVRTRTNADGAFMAELPIPLYERPGVRELVVESSDGVVGTIEIEILHTQRGQVGVPGFGLGG